jgi:hypothetical protein
MLFSLLHRSLQKLAADIFLHFLKDNYINEPFYRLLDINLEPSFHDGSFFIVHHILLYKVRYGKIN